MKRRPLIAVVDDGVSIRRALVRLMRASQFEVEAFESAQACLRSLRKRQPDCLVLDLHMAPLTGRDVQRRLAAAHMQLPVIIITALEDPMLEKECLADGAVALLRKPVRADTLLSSIRAATGEHG